jgi:hypothetical protein
MNTNRACSHLWARTMFEGEVGGPLPEAFEQTFQTLTDGDSEMVPSVTQCADASSTAWFSCKDTRVV